MNSQPYSVMGRVRQLLTEDPQVSAAQMFTVLSQEFPKVNPTWLRSRIGSNRYHILKRRELERAKRGDGYP